MSGIYAYSGSGISAIDDKDRLSIPAFLRKDLVASSGDRTVCIGKHEKWNCLVGFGLSRKIDMLAEIDREEANAIARGEPYDRDVASFLKFNSIKDLSFDASGRFGLPDGHRIKGNIKDKVIFFGMGLYFCMWDPETLLDTTDNVPVDKDEVKRLLAELGKKK